MRFTFLRLLTRRPDRRPLYRRIFTNKRLDIAHLVTLRLLFGTVLLISSFSAVNIFVYYKYIKPIQREKAEQIEKELLEADLAGFKVK
ncbi:Hypothetical protein SRAE_2000089000 [Strongyloides ratti]|uniref:Uncharacterized protein n=1 Tax=Strongyloides ratti TaxID=34506 RepID=A0A090LFH9_STRRB|nr:Hypothetical protein SRAE_2000089000 [Strongyloides ratti]CEF66220.1 Hypothetical protein SRAE_2000089000 [Strongyloides ratti]